jgi:hypothetical protein
VPPAVDKVVLKALEKDPHNRYRTASDFVAALRAAFQMGEARPRDLEKPPTDTTPIVAKGDETLAVAEADMAMALEAHKRRQQDNDLLEFGPTSGKQARKKRRVRLPCVAFLLLLIWGGIALSILAVYQADHEVIVTLREGIQNAIDSILVRINPEYNPDTPAAPDSSAAPKDNRAVLRYRYDLEAFALVNNSDKAVDLSGLEFARGEPGGRDDFRASALPGGTMLAPQNCVLIAAAADMTPPDDWGCEESVAARKDAANLFWRDDGTNKTFRVLFNGEEITPCPMTTSEDKNRECSIAW